MWTAFAPYAWQAFEVCEGRNLEAAPRNPPRGVGRRGLSRSTGAVTSRPAGDRKRLCTQPVKGWMPSSATSASTLAYWLQNLPHRTHFDLPSKASNSWLFLISVF